MTTMLTEVYDAFVSAGISDDKARKAAEALSGHERRFDRLENTIDLRFANLKNEIDARFVALKSEMNTRFAALKSDMDTRFAKVDGELALLKWMLGFNLAATVGVLFFLLRH